MQTSARSPDRSPPLGGVPWRAASRKHPGVFNMSSSRVPTLGTALLALALSTPSISRAADDLPLVGYPSGTAHARSCPDNSVMTGMRARVGTLIDAVGVRCSPIGTNGTLGAESNAGSMFGGTGGTERIRSCPTGTVVVGQRLGFMTVPFTILRVSFYCRGWSPATRTTTGSSVLVDLVTSPLATLGNESSASCPSTSRPVRKIRGKSGTSVGALGFTCDSP
jgi:hypothetical protein